MASRLLYAQILMTHEQYLMAVRDAALLRVDPALRTRLSTIKLVYSVGYKSQTRGQTHHDCWRNPDGELVPLVEVCADGESSPLQLMCTLLHELAHVLVGQTLDSHGDVWTVACRQLGLLNDDGTGRGFTQANLDALMLEVFRNLPCITDGTPHFKGQDFFYWSGWSHSHLSEK